MIDHSALMDEALHYSHTLATSVDFFVGGELKYQNVRVVEGKYECDRGSTVRWSSTIVLAIDSWEDFELLDTYKTRYKLFRGVASLGRTEMLQLGEYRVDLIDRRDDGTISIEGSGLEVYVHEDRFLSPRPPPTGWDTVSAMQYLISESVPRLAGAWFVSRATENRIIQSTAPWERERSEALDDLGESIGVDWFAGNDGRFYLRDKPSTVGRPPLVLLQHGAGQVLLGRSRKVSHDRFNAVSASGQSSDPAVPPVWGWARVTEPGHPLNWDGDYGHNPRFYSSQFLTTVEQCERTAQNMLTDEIAAHVPMIFESLPLIFLEAGDVVSVMFADGSQHPHLIQKLTGGLGPGSKITVDARTSLSVQDSGVTS